MHVAFRQVEENVAPFPGPPSVNEPAGATHLPAGATHLMFVQQPAVETPRQSRRKGAD
jgi:hypothetical protein